MKLPKLPPIDPGVVINFSSTLSWGITDPERFAELMTEALTLIEPGYHLGDNLLTWGKNNSFFDDAAFVEAWKKNALNGSDKTIVWRRYILACAGFHAIHLSGDFVECGVYMGSGIKTVMDYLGGPEFPKKFWGYDTFDYNPVEGHAFPGQTEGLFDSVIDRFSGYSQVRLVKGLIPDSFDDASPESIAFLHIDLNSANAELAVLDRFFHRVVPGGIVILDDYEWAMIYREQKAQEDVWLDQRGYRVFPLPTGQGLVIKR